MMIPLQITFRHMQTSAALEARIRELAARLDKFSAHIRRCHVLVEPPPGHSQQGGVYNFHIDIGLPDQEIAIHRARPENHAHEDPYVALRDAFLVARRKLQDYERRRRSGIRSGTGVEDGQVA